MKKFIKEYLKVISTTIIGLIFLVASFYLVINYYHSEELKRPLYIGSNDLNYINYQETLNKISTNLTIFRNKHITDQNLNTMYNKLITCQTVMQGEGTLATLNVNNYFYPTDVYNLASKFQSDILNICWALHLSYLTEEGVDTKFQSISPYIKTTVDTISNQTNFALSEIQNNSSYFYSTNITASTIRNYLNADYDMIAKSYNEFANIVLSLSEEILKDSGGEIND